MRRIPLVSTLIVLAAVATMIGLGVWQLDRARWKDGLIASYAAAAGQPPVPFPHDGAADAVYFRRSRANCARIEGWDAIAGTDAAGRPGIAHIARCVTDAGQRFKAVMGVNDDPATPRWAGGGVGGVIAPDTAHLARLIADAPAPGLRANARPDVADVPNNHLAYAGQWFLFAVSALVIYGLALRRRLRRPED